MTQPNPDDDIIPIDPREHVRKRPRLYFGGVDRSALHLLIWEVLGTAVEAALAGLCDRMSVSLHNDYRVIVHDNGPGLPAHWSENSKRSPLEVIMTVMGQGRQSFYTRWQVSGGLQGIGYTAVNAASESCTAEVARDGYLWRQQYREGKPIAEVEQVRPLNDGEFTGTTITFKPDFTIFEQHEFDFEEISARCQTLAFLLPGVRLAVRDERGETPSEHTYFSEHGVADFVAHLNAENETVTPMIHGISSFNNIVRYGYDDAVQVAFAFQYTDSIDPIVKGFVNTIEITHGGTYLDGIYDALLSLVNRGKSPNKLTREDVERGLVVVIDIRHPAPSYKSIREIRLLNTDIYHFVAAALHEHFGRWLMMYPEKEHLKAVIARCEENRQVRTGHQ